MHLSKNYEGQRTLDELDYEYALDCSGYKFNGPRNFMLGGLKKCLEPRTGQIMVNQYCQVTDQHPFDEREYCKVYDNIFSFGDVCLTPSNELKTIVSMYQYVDMVA